MRISSSVASSAPRRRARRTGAPARGERAVQEHEGAHDAGDEPAQPRERGRDPLGMAAGHPVGEKRAEHVEQEHGQQEADEGKGVVKRPAEGKRADEPGQRDEGEGIGEERRGHRAGEARELDAVEEGGGAFKQPRDEPLPAAFGGSHLLHAAVPQLGEGGAPAVSRELSRMRSRKITILG